MALDQKIKIAEFSHGVEYAANELANQIIEMTRGTGAAGSVVGVSGGIDSATVTYLCNYAFIRDRKLNPDLKPMGLLGVLMPSNANDPKDIQDGLRVVEACGIEKEIIEIEPLVRPYVEALGIDNEFDLGNLYSETRATVLSRIGAKHNYRVMGTGNWDEDYVLGYFTKRGDGAVDNNILGNLPKRLVRELAEFLGVADDIVNRVPTAGLWEGQTDEGELGYSYSQAEIIQRGYNQGLSAREIVDATEYDLGIVSDVARRHFITEHKRRVAPIGEVSLEFR
ncbi:NAD(+) synthase [Candidatus Pacearchaeota archaeon]|nr:NAD(+) synthase [Candidatus Pacearchaeota archaeon]